MSIQDDSFSPYKFDKALRVRECPKFFSIVVPPNKRFYFRAVLKRIGFAIARSNFLSAAHDSDRKHNTVHPLVCVLVVCVFFEKPFEKMFQVAESFIATAARSPQINRFHARLLKRFLRQSCYLFGGKGIAEILERLCTG